MFAFFLALISCAGGCTATYFIMDGARREAVKLKAELAVEKDDLAEKRDRLREQTREHNERSQQLAASFADYNRRESTLAQRTAEFDQRVIPHQALEAENRIIKADLKNVAAHIAYLEHTRHAIKTAAEAIAAGRDQLGELYLDELSNGVNRTLTQSNYTVSKERLLTGMYRVRSTGAEVTSITETGIIAALDRQRAKVARAIADREEQIRIRE